MKRTKTIFIYLAIFLGLMLMSRYAMAGGALPWEGPLKKIQESLTGPIARAIGVLAMAITGMMLAFGGELSEFAKRMCMVVLALAVMLLANDMITGIGLAKN